MKGENLTQTQEVRNTNILKAWFPFWVTNTFLNYKDILEEFQKEDMSLFTLAECGKGKPAVIVGSGPSLDNTAPLLKDWKGAVFSSASNAKVCARWGKEPDFICVFDAGDAVYDQLKNYEWKDSCLITHPAVSPKVMDYWEWKKRYYIMMHLEHNWFEQVNPIAFGGFPRVKEFGYEQMANIKVAILNAGCSVNNQIQIAHWMGYDPLFLLGVDFGYPNNKHRCTNWEHYSDKWHVIPPTPIPPERPKHTSDNGIITTEEQIEYKLALFCVLKLDKPMVYDCSDGIITELIKLDFKEVIEKNGKGFERWSKEEIIRRSNEFLIGKQDIPIKRNGDRENQEICTGAVSGDGKCKDKISGEKDKL